MYMKKKIYIFNQFSRASLYGIGTYIKQLIDCLKDTEIDFGIIHLYSDKKKIADIYENGYREIFMPSVITSDINAKEYYYRNITYLLKELIPEEKNIQYIFHLNFMTNPYLVKNLKRMFMCKIIVVLHYTEWSFSLLGNYNRLKITTQKKKDELTKFEKNIVRDVEEDIKMIKESDRVICVAKHSISYLTEICNINPSQCTLINNALKDEYKEISLYKKNNIRKKYFIPPYYKVIVFAGRLDEVKGVSFLINAFKNVLKRNPNTLLFIAGDGDFSQYINKAERCWSRILFTGRVNKKVLYELYHIADIGIVCSLHEEFGFVAIEMMMHKLPIIVTNTGGLSEIVEDNISGIKIPVTTIKGKRGINTIKMAQKINLLLEDRNLALTIAEKGRMRFLEKYEFSLFKEKMIKQYSNI